MTWWQACVVLTLYAMLLWRVLALQDDVRALKRRVRNDRVTMSEAVTQLQNRHDRELAGWRSNAQTSDTMLGKVLRERNKLVQFALNNQGEWPLIMCGRCRLPITAEQTPETSDGVMYHIDCR